MFLFVDFNVNIVKYYELTYAKSFYGHYVLILPPLVNFINNPVPFHKRPGSPSLLHYFSTYKVKTVANIGLHVSNMTDHMLVFATIGIPLKKKAIQNLNPHFVTLGTLTAIS